MSAALLIGSFEPGSPEWHAARANGIGGSEVAPILGLSPFESRFSLWHRKAGNIGPVDESPEMEWGKRLEPVIIGKYRDEHPDLDFTVVNGTFCHRDRPWQIANPDLLAGDRIVETKFAVYGDHWGTPGTDEIPVWYRTQVLWYCDVLGYDRADVAVLIAGHDYREYTVLYDPDEAAQLRDAARAFLDEVAAGIQPDIDAHSATYQAIRAMHPEITDAEVELSDDLARTYIAARRRLHDAEQIEQHARSRVAAAMGNARTAVWDGRTIARRQARGEGGTPYVAAARDLHAIDLDERDAA